MSKYTPWFPGDVRPTRPGVYQRKFPSGSQHYSRWNGRAWLSYDYEPALAETSRIESHSQSLPWRGLMKEPAQ